MLPFRRIVVPTDFSETSLSGFSAAVEIARHFRAELVLFHVLPVEAALWDVPPYADFGLTALPPAEFGERARSEAMRRLERIASEPRPDGPKIRCLVGRGEPAREIAKLAGGEPADLVVMATHGWTGWRHLVFGSVAEKTLRECRCPVLSIHPADLAAMPPGSLSSS